MLSYVTRHDIRYKLKNREHNKLWLRPLLASVGKRDVANSEELLGGDLAGRGLVDLKDVWVRRER